MERSFRKYSGGLYKVIGYQVYFLSLPKCALSYNKLTSKERKSLIILNSNFTNPNHPKQTQFFQAIHNLEGDVRCGCDTY